MNARWRGTIVALVAGCSISCAAACGFCIEDKIASVYDHAVATRAIAQKHTVVFFALEGHIPPGGRSRRKLEQIAESIAGVDKGSARASVESASLSAAFDPARTPFAMFERALSRKLRTEGLTVGILRVMEQASELKVAGQR